MVDYPAFRVCLMAKCCLSQCSKALYLIVLKHRICFLNTGKLWWSVLPQVECTSAQMILYGKQAFVNTQKPFFHWKWLAVLPNERQTGNLFGSSVWRAVLLEAWGVSGEGDPKLKRRRRRGGPTRKIHFNVHILICSIVFLDRGYCFFQQVPGASWKFCSS